MRTAFLVLLLSLSSLSPAVAGDSDGGEALSRFLEGTTTLRAAFRQSLLTANAAEPQVSEGVLMIKRPGRFRWEYSAPTEQLVVCDGARLWMYDPDLEQVTVRPIDESLRGTPAMLLSGQATLDETFRVLESYEEGGLEWVRLEPLAGSPEFDTLVIGLEGGVLRQMELTDSLGQRTRIELTDVNVGADLDDSLFLFTPPDGADVIGQGDKL